MAVLAVVLFLKQATKILIQFVFLFEVLTLYMCEGGSFFLHTEYMCKQCTGDILDIMVIYWRETKAAFP